MFAATSSLQGRIACFIEGGGHHRKENLYLAKYNNMTVFIMQLVSAWETITKAAVLSL